MRRIGHIFLTIVMLSRASCWMPAFTAVVAVALLPACKRERGEEDIRVERVAKTPSPAPAPPPPQLGPAPIAPVMPSASASSTPPVRGGMTTLPGMEEFTAANPTPQWSPPAAWQAQPPNPVRKGSWLVPPPADASGGVPVEISVNVFQGQLGGLLANVNRWRGQVGLPSNVTDATLPQAVQNITLGGRPAQLISLDGPDGRSLEGALVFLPDRVWSFRMTGPTAAVADQRAAFREFLNSVQW